MSARSTNYARLLGCTALMSAGLLLPATAWAQDEAGSTGLEEIIVTAQKREQSVQDVPIAVTAVTAASLQANRIHTVNDLSSIAPGLTVKPSAGGIQVPAFTMRGQVSYGVVAGSDKQVSIYVDGVYLGNPRGSIFDLPDIARLEVLRGPQGTLFGRNATAGAISITTRDPSGEAHFKLTGSYGNRDAYRIRATIDTPQWGPFSAYFSYVRDSKRGDIRNAAAGTVWDRSLSNDPAVNKITRSPEYLGSIDSHSYFAAVKFEPSDRFRMVYKYDRNDDHGTPEGTSFIGWDKSLGGGLAGGVMTALYTSNQTYINPTGLRPEVVTNGWVIPREQHIEGHSVTATWKATDSITVKNVFAMRKALVFAPSSIDGVGHLTFTQQAIPPYATLAAAGFLAANVPGFSQLDPATQGALIAQAVPGFIQALTPALLNKRLLVVDSAAFSRAKQWSNEIQVNYSSERLQVTLGGLWFHSDDVAGGAEGLQNTPAWNFTPTCGCLVPQTGLLPRVNEGRYFNKATSLAAYAQVEYKITPQIEVIAGARITHDKKTSSFKWSVGSVAQPLIVPPDYSKTKPNFLIGVNWKPNPDTLVYAKYSTSFVSGGSVAGITFQPEEAKSFEIGLKADFFDRKLRTNIALYHVTYNHFQSAGSTSSETSKNSILPILTALYTKPVADNLVGSLSTFVVDNGKLRVNGFEAEITAAPARGVLVGGSLAYTDPKFLYLEPNIIAAYGSGYQLRDRPKWTGSVFGQFETEPLFGESTLSVRLDALYRSADIRFTSPSDIYADKSNAAVATIPGYWLLNGRVALKRIQIGPVEAELSVWGKNLTDVRHPNFVLFTPLATSANYGPARTFGVELGLDF